MSDRYIRWYNREMSEISAPAPLVARVKDLETLVLEDLAKAESEAEKLEIMDSYSLACQRRYRNQLLDRLLDSGKGLLEIFLKPVLAMNIPPIRPPYRPLYGTRVNDPEKEASSE